MSLHNTSPTELTVILSLHDALPILLELRELRTERLLYPQFERCVVVAERDAAEVRRVAPAAEVVVIPYGTDTERSEEHTSELQSRGHLVCRLLLEKKNITTIVFIDG